MPSCSVPTVPSRPISFQSRGQPAGHVQAAYRIDRRELIRRPLWGDVQDAHSPKGHVDSAHRPVPRAKG